VIDVFFIFLELVNIKIDRKLTHASKITSKDSIEMKKVHHSRVKKNIAKSLLANVLEVITDLKSSNHSLNDSQRYLKNAPKVIINAIFISLVAIIIMKIPFRKERLALLFIV